MVDGGRRFHFGYADLAMAGLALIAFVYTAIRIYSMSITFDEAWAFKYFLEPRDLSVLKHFFSLFYKDANNHLLNTLLMRLTTWIFGYEEWSLRLPVIGAHLLFLFFSWQLARDLDSPMMGIALFVALNFNPFVLDFFSIARGYGLAMGLTAASLWFFARYFRSGCTRSLIRGLWFSSLSVFANLSFLNVYCALLAMYLAREIYLYRRQPGPGALWPFIRIRLKGDRNRIATNLWVTFIINGIFIARLGHAGALVHGTDLGFWPSAVGSLIESTLYGERYAFANVSLLVSVIQVTLIVLVMASVACKLAGASKILDDDTLYLGLLLLCGISVFLQNVLFSVPYPLDRTTLLFFPLYVLAIFTGVRALVRCGPKVVRVVCVAFLALLTAATAAHAARTMNLDSTYLWRYDEESEAIMRQIARDARGLTGDGPLVINIDREWRFQSSFNYYLFLLGLNDFAEVVRVRELPDPGATYIVMDQGMIKSDIGPLIEVAKWKKQPLRVMRRPAPD